MNSDQGPWRVGDKAVIVLSSAYGSSRSVEIVTVTKVGAAQLTLSNGRRATIRTTSVHGVEGRQYRRDDPYAMGIIAQAALRELARRAENAAGVWGRNKTVENGQAVLTTMQAWLDAQAAGTP